MVLLTEYLEAMDQHDGPDSTEAIKFFEEHKNNVRFARQANTAAVIWRMRCHSAQIADSIKNKVHAQEKPATETTTLLGQYANLLNTCDGPDSAQAKEFFEEHKENKKFEEIAKIGASLWIWHHASSK